MKLLFNIINIHIVKGSLESEFFVSKPAIILTPPKHAGVNCSHEIFSLSFLLVALTTY